MPRPRNIQAVFACIHLRQSWVTAEAIATNIGLTKHQVVKHLSILKSKGKVEYRPPEQRGPEGERLGGQWKSTIPLKGESVQ